MDFEPLKLKATNHEQLDVLSALLQDSLFHMHMCSFHQQSERRVSFLLNRFCWEYEDDDSLEHYRIHTCVYIYNVNNVHINTQFLHHNRVDFLNLLGIHSTNDGQIMLLFSENKCIKIDIDDILVYMKDIQTPWITYTVPHHHC